MGRQPSRSRDSRYPLQSRTPQPASPEFQHTPLHAHRPAKRHGLRLHRSPPVLEHLQKPVGLSRCPYLPLHEPDLSALREPFLSLPGYEIYANPEPCLVEETPFRISHRAGPSEEAPPIHIVYPFQEPGKVYPHAQPRYSSHVLLQEFLNRTGHLRELVTNGRYPRLLRDSVYIRRQSYANLNLAGILEEERSGAFEVLYWLLHIFRLPVPLRRRKRVVWNDITQKGTSKLSKFFTVTDSTKKTRTPNHLQTNARITSIRLTSRTGMFIRPGAIRNCVFCAGIRRSGGATAEGVFVRFRSEVGGIGKGGWTR